MGHYHRHYWQSAHWLPYGSLFLPSTYSFLAFWHCMCSPVRGMKHECQVAENKSWGCPTLPQNLPAHLPPLTLPNLTPSFPVIHRLFNRFWTERSCDQTSIRNARDRKWHHHTQQSIKAPSAHYLQPAQSFTCWGEGNNQELWTEQLRFPHHGKQVPPDKNSWHGSHRRRLSSSETKFGMQSVLGARVTATIDYGQHFSTLFLSKLTNRITKD